MKLFYFIIIGIALNLYSESEELCAAKHLMHKLHDFKSENLSTLHIGKELKNKDIELWVIRHAGHNQNKIDPSRVASGDVTISIPLEKHQEYLLELTYHFNHTYNQANFAILNEYKIVDSRGRVVATHKVQSEFHQELPKGDTDKDIFKVELKKLSEVLDSVDKKYSSMRQMTLTTVQGEVINFPLRLSNEVYSFYSEFVKNFYNAPFFQITKEVTNLYRLVTKKAPISHKGRDHSDLVDIKNYNELLKKSYRYKAENAGLFLLDRAILTLIGVYVINTGFNKIQSLASDDDKMNSQKFQKEFEEQVLNEESLKIIAEKMDLSITELKNLLYTKGDPVYFTDTKQDTSQFQIINKNDSLRLKKIN